MARWIVWCFSVCQLMINQSTIWPSLPLPSCLIARYGLSCLTCSIFALSFRSISVCVLLRSAPEKARTRISFVRFLLVFRWCRTVPYYWYVCNQNLVPVRVSVCERALNFTKAIAAEQVESELVWCLVRCRRISRFAVGFNRLYLRRITTPRKASPSDRHLFVFV